VAYAFGEFELDVSTMELRDRGSVVQVPPKVLDVLIYLVRNRDRVVSSKELLEAVWPGVTVGANSIAQTIASIRRVLKDDSDDPGIIRTLHARGYRFVAMVEKQADSAAAGSPSDRVPFVGRDELLQRCWRRVEQARAGRGDILFVTGAVGVGKTRVVRQLGKVMEARSCHVLSARCDEDIGAPELWPWRQLVRSSESAGPGRRGAPIAASSEEEALFAASAKGGSSNGGFELFDRIRVWLKQQASRHSPLLVVIEDLNWADAASLLLLKFVAQEISRMPVLLVCTYRDAPVQPELARVVGAICRDDPARRIQLEGLDLSAAMTLAKQLEPSVTAPELVKHVWEKSQGNPLFLIQLLHVAGAEELSGPVSNLTSMLLAPEAVREAIAAHVQLLSTACQEALSVAAVFGHEFDLASLARTTKKDPSQLIDLLDEAIRARIIATVPKKAKGTFAFLHGVVRDVLYRKLSIAERTRWHRIVGQSLAELWDAGVDVDPLVAARHFGLGAAAGDTERGIRWLVKASKKPGDAGTRAVAAALLERAIELTKPPAIVSPEVERLVQEALDEWTEEEPRSVRTEALRTAGGSASSARGGGS
jgi:predicted ATPase/DNA-binding winged helix-turn-helix (wHTH) protein